MKDDNVEIMPAEEQTIALMAITQGEVDMQVATAKRYPRSVSACIKKAVDLATLDKATAESCFFALPRAGTLVEGPSVRLAEIMASSWGNMRCESRIIEENQKHVTAQATAWDMESNVLIRIESKRRITDKRGNRYKDDMILMTQNAAISIALRNAVFRVVPRSLVDHVYHMTRKVALGDAMTLTQRRTEALKSFAKLGVTEERILSVLDKQDIRDVDAEDLSKLLGAWNAIREGTITVEEAFPELPENGQAASNGNGASAKPEEPTPEPPKQNGSKTDQVLEKLQKGKSKGKNTPVSKEALESLITAAKSAGLGSDRGIILTFCRKASGAHDLERLEDLTMEEFQAVLDELDRMVANEQ